MTKKTFLVGGIWDGPQWEIQEQWEGDARYYETCPHAIREGDRVQIHRVLVAWNEAGHNSTGVCVNCILDAIKEME